jgi:hypothetical protein
MADSLNINLSDAEVVESCLQVVRSTVRVVRKEVPTADGKAEKLCVAFSTNRGKGSGAQVMPVEEFPAFIAALREANDSGFATAETPAVYRPASEVAQETLSLIGDTDEDGAPVGEPDTVTFRTRTGKGSKPARIPLSEADEVITYLESRLPKLQAVIDSLTEDSD